MEPRVAVAVGGSRSAGDWGEPALASTPSLPAAAADPPALTGSPSANAIARLALPRQLPAATAVPPLLFVLKALLHSRAAAAVARRSAAKAGPQAVRARPLTERQLEGGATRLGRRFLSPRRATTVVPELPRL